jgi:hypothetical protein
MKWHWSRLQRSTVASSASRCRFFKSRLGFRIRFRDHPTGFATSKPELAEYALTLPHAELHPIELGQVVRQKLTVPQVLLVSQVTGIGSQIPIHLAQMLVRKPPWTTGALALFQTHKAIPFEPVHPPLDGTRILSQPLRNPMTAQSVSNQQNPVQAVVVPGFFRSHNFLLNGNLHNFRIGDLQFSHSPALLSPKV